MTGTRGLDGAQPVDTSPSQTACLTARSLLRRRLVARVRATGLLVAAPSMPGGSTCRESFRRRAVSNLNPVSAALK